MIACKSFIVSFAKEMSSHSLRLMHTHTSPRMCLSTSMSFEVNDFHSAGIFRRIFRAQLQRLFLCGFEKAVFQLPHLLLQACRYPNTILVTLRYLFWKLIYFIYLQTENAVVFSSGYPLF